MGLLRMLLFRLQRLLPSLNLCLPTGRREAGESFEH